MRTVAYERINWPSAAKQPLKNLFHNQNASQNTFNATQCVLHCGSEAIFLVSWDEGKTVINLRIIMEISHFSSEKVFERLIRLFPDEMRSPILRLEKTRAVCYRDLVRRRLCLHRQMNHFLDHIELGQQRSKGLLMLLFVILTRRHSIRDHRADAE